MTDAFRTELVRAAAFAKASVTQLSKAVALYDATPAPTGIWTSPEELAALPMTGPEWDTVWNHATSAPPEANIADQDSHHDQYTLAAALAAVRTGAAADITVARVMLREAVGTEDGGRWLAVGRNLGAYIVAADLMRAIGQLSTVVDGWIRTWPLKLLPDNNTGVPRRWAAFRSGSNASAQEGFAQAALAAYLGDEEMLSHVWDRFRLYAGDPTAPGEINLKTGINGGWAHDPEHPTAVVPASHPNSGAIINDMARGGDYTAEPGWTQYPWVGIEGFIPCALILHRAGCPAFEVADMAVLRTLAYLHDLRKRTGDVRWFDGERASSCVQIVNAHYGTMFPCEHPVGRGRTVGFTDWSHA